MKKLYFLFFLGVFFGGCKPYQSTKIRKGQITYSEFRAQQRSFPVKNGIIKYIDKGNGPVILLLHGVPTSGWLYRKMIDPLVAGGYRVIVPDMLGYGSSDSPEGYKIYSEKEHAKRILELMDGLGIEYWSHVMHDVGGIWTWELMKQAPKRIEELIVMNTLIYEEGFYPPIRFSPGPAAKAAMWSYRNGVTTNALLKGLFKGGLKENTMNELDIEGYKTPLLEGKTDGMYYFFTRTCNYFPDYSLIFENIDIPVAVIWGIHDTILQWTPQQTKVINALKIEKEDIHLIDEKHFIQETKAEEIAYKILEFLK